MAVSTRDPADVKTSRAARNLMFPRRAS